MAKKYETGTKEEVLREMLRCAIQDRESLAELHTMPKWASADPGDHEVIAECDAAIRDFKRLAKALMRSI